MTNGFKTVIALSPNGSRLIITGSALEVAQETIQKNVWTIHELANRRALVAIIPLDWALSFELNQ